MGKKANLTSLQCVAAFKDDQYGSGPMSEIRKKNRRNCSKFVQFSKRSESNYERNDANEISLANLNILLKYSQCFAIQYNL